MLSQAQLEQFHREGYLVVDDLLDLDQDIQPLINEYNALLDERCETWQAEGLIERDYAELPFEERLVELLKKGCDYSRYMDISLPMDGIKADTPIHLGKAVFNLITSPRLLSAVTSFIGPEIYSNPIQHVRIKPPAKHLPDETQVSSLMTKTNWHQDQAVALPEADESQVLTVWIAVNDATVENGCLEVVRGSHRKDLSLHCTGRVNKDAIYIPEALIEDENVVAAPVKAGGALFMHSRTHHSSLDNNSDSFRWSFDLRYNPVGQATGRDMFPGFIAQSLEQPETVVRDPKAWAELWLNARETLSKQDRSTFNRWGDIVSELCA